MATKEESNYLETLTEVRIATDAMPEGFPLHLPPFTSREEAASSIAREAMRWTYVLRSRRRWVGDSRARERYEEEARAALKSIGITDDILSLLAKSERVVVRIPYPNELLHWESRVFPWEYVITAATRDQRIQLSGSGLPRPLTVMRELQRQPLPPRPNANDLFKNGLKMLFVECLPSELREHWTLDSERNRLRAVLPASSDWHVLNFPSLEELRSAIATIRPQLIHFAGLDSHQGLRELRKYIGAGAYVDLGNMRASEPVLLDDADGPTDPWNLALVDDVLSDQRPMVDGILLRGESGEERTARGGKAQSAVSYPRLVRAHELALQLVASGHTAYMVTFGLWNTSARVAPLVVAEGAALASVGFQDAFDDALAEFVYATLYAELCAGGWNLPQAFHRTWLTVRQLPESVDATGVTLWAGSPILGGPAVESLTPVKDTVLKKQPAIVTCDIKPCAELNYAVLHNAQPLFEKFVLESDRTGDDVQVDVEVVVHMGSETAKYRRRVNMVHRRIALTREIHVPLTAGIARAVRETISSSLSVEVQQDGRVLYCDTHRLRLLPVDQWRDNRRDGRWLPSFVQPRDAAVTQALAQAQRYVRVLRDDPSAGFEGYQLADSRDEASLRSVDRQVDAIWATLLHDWNLGYINPPPTYSGTLDSQRLRMPSTILEHRAGTCIDLALLFAACLELIDIYPVIFLLEGHALPGWWRHSKFRDEYFEMPADKFAELVEGSQTENAMANAQSVAWHTGKASWPEVKRWIRERKLVPIETVRLTEHCGFVEAVEAGVAALAERRDFDSMLEMVTARTEQVTPLPIRGESA